jgi:ABC-type polysaccharide/polyol phosphate export permease
MYKLWGYDLAFCWSVFKVMLRVDLQQARGTVLSKIIDRFVWVASFLLISAYLLPSFGMSADFGKFMLVGMIASLGIVEAYSVIALIISDLDGDKVITYFLTLPIPPVLVFIRILVYYGLYFTVLSSLLFPICNLLLPESIAYSTIHWPKCIFMLLLSSFSHAAIILWAASFVRDMRMLGQVWSRLLHPLWFLGGFQFKWAALYQKSPVLGYLALCNPIIHITEGMRGAVFGPVGYLPYWLTTTTLMVLIVCMTIHAIIRFKKRLDLV